MKLSSVSFANPVQIGTDVFKYLCLHPANTTFLEELDFNIEEAWVEVKFKGEWYICPTFNVAAMKAVREVENAKHLMLGADPTPDKSPDPELVGDEPADALERLEDTLKNAPEVGEPASDAPEPSISFSGYGPGSEETIPPEPVVTELRPEPSGDQVVPTGRDIPAHYCECDIKHHHFTKTCKRCAKPVRPRPEAPA